MKHYPALAIVISLVSVHFFFCAVKCAAQENTVAVSEFEAAASDDVRSHDCCCGSRLSLRPKHGITLRDMWDREFPDGTQHGHIRYWSTGTYYYHRPYNASHYRQHRDRLLSNARPYAPHEAKRGYEFGYEYVQSSPAHLFRPLRRKANPVDDRVDNFDDSRELEFADSIRYRHAKMAWEKKKQESGNKTPARLSSHAK